MERISELWLSAKNNDNNITAPIIMIWVLEGLTGLETVGKQDQLQAFALSVATKFLRVKKGKALAFGFCLWVLPLGFAFGFRLWVSPLGFAFGFRLRVLPSRFAFAFCLRVLPSRFAVRHRSNGRNGFNSMVVVNEDSNIGKERLGSKQQFRETMAKLQYICTIVKIRNRRIRAGSWYRTLRPPRTTSSIWRWSWVNRPRT